LKTSATITYKVAVQEIYTTHKLYASQMSVFRKKIVLIYIWKSLKFI